MKVYYYPPEQVGKPYPKGGASLAGFERTTNPDEADCFLLVNSFDEFTNEELLNLPYMKGNERRHILFSLHENPDRLIGIPAIIFRADNNKRLRDRGEVAFTQPWGSEDWYAKMGPATNFEYDVCFQGQDNSARIAKQCCDSVVAAGLKAHVKINDTFYGVYETNGDVETTKRLKESYLQTLHASKLSLCPYSLNNGIVRYRLYETMAMARIPVLVGNDCILPLEDRIQWNKCIIRIDEKDVPRTGEILREFLKSHTDKDIRGMGQLAHWYWSEFLDDDIWEVTWAMLVTERLAQL